MISILANLVVGIMKREVECAKYFSIECDEVTSHKKAFMSVVIRYVHDFKIWERCIKLERISSLKGKDLADIIVAILKDMNFQLINLIGKGFDGASTMSGKGEGVQQHLTEAGAYKSLYFYCFAHWINLVLEKSAENVAPVNDVFDIIGAICRYLEGSPQRHTLFKEKMKMYNIVKGKTALHSLSDTRWAARSDNLDPVINAFPAIISMLKEMSGKGESAADGLLVRMLPFKFIASCLILKSFLLSRCISEYLQREDMDLVSAVSGIQSLQDTLSSFRNDVKLDEFLSKAKEFCEQSEVDVVEVGQQSCPKRQRTLPSYFRDGSVLLDQDALVLQADPPGEESTAYLFDTNFYFPLLDRLENELEK